MSKYRCRAFVSRDDAGWELLETTTKQVVSRSLFEDDITKAMQFMEKGGAFAGSTPRFFTEPVFHLPVK